ncbi:hypothetical protein JCM10212_003556 [Sporobolomyces blumeae]
MLASPGSTLLLAVTLAAHATALQIPWSLDVTQQPDASPPVDQPYRPLPWGDVNIISTTDTHGWLLGHQRNEPSFSGDWGDLYSFVSRLKDEARRRGVDLLVVDSGDRVDGNGLVDAEPAPHPKGSTALSLFSKMPYDLITTGNHELYRYPVARYAREVLSDKYHDKWVVSNVNITLNDDGDGQGERDVLFGNRFRKFDTEQGRKVTAFGPLFDFKAHAPGITVQKPSDMVEEEWFLEAIADRPDFFLFAGHMSVRIEPDSEWRTIIRAIRKVHPTVPVLVFGGHHHIRDCVQEDKYSMSLAAGRYMETVGFASLSGLDEPDKAPRFARRYLDQNRNTYAYHIGMEDFDTDKGRQITRELTKTAERFNLTETYGVSPQDYFLHRYPSTSPHSIFHLLTTEILPTLVKRRDRPVKPYTVLNTGSVRFDLFKGNFTRNDQWICLPFPNNFLYIPSVPYRLAKRLLPYLNLVGEHGFLPTQRLFESDPSSSSSAPTTSIHVEYAKHFERSGIDVGQMVRAAEEVRAEHSRRNRLVEAYETYVSSRTAPGSAIEESDDDVEDANRKGPQGTTMGRPVESEGYVTLDSCGPERRGDDTLHVPFKVARQPTFVATRLPSKAKTDESGRQDERSQGRDDDDWEEETRVDVVFFDFIQPDILSALNFLDQPIDDSRQERRRRPREHKEWSEQDVRLYLDDLTANTLLETWAKKAWN